MFKMFKIMLIALETESFYDLPAYKPSICEKLD